MLLYKIIKTILYVIIRIFWPIIINGEENTNIDGPYILAANHISYLDPIILGISLKKPINFLAKKEVFDNPFLGFLARNIGAIPVDRKNASSNSLAVKKSLNILNKGKVLGIFPEGTRSLDGKLLNFNSGIIKLSLKTGAPVLPVGIIGTFDIYPPKSKIPKLFYRKKIILNIGKPIFFNNTKAKDIHYQQESLEIIKEKIKYLSA